MNLVWAIKAPNGEVAESSKSTSRKEAWRKFLWPSLKKRAFLKDGWRAFRMTKTKFNRLPKL